MSCSNAIYYKPCTRCKRYYSVRYFGKHDCDSSNKMQKFQVDVDDTNGEFGNSIKESEINHLDEPAQDQETVYGTPLLNSNLSNHETEGFVDDNNDEGSNDDILHDDIDQKLFQEAFLLRKIFLPKTVVVVYQLCLIGYACS